MKDEKEPLEQKQNSEEEEYSFLQEIIKDEAGDQAKWKHDVLRRIQLGLIFGLVACNPAPKLPSASLFLSASQPMGISLCQNDLCILLFFNAFNWFINHETTKYHSHRSPVCQGF